MWIDKSWIIIKNQILDAYWNGTQQFIQMAKSSFEFKWDHLHEC